MVGTGRDDLRLGRLRLVFVADLISRELRRVIEFLNEQMTQTEVIGVEIRQYVDASGAHQTVVPRLIGQTEAARDIKTRSSAAGMRRYDVSMADLIDAGLIPGRRPADQSPARRWPRGAVHPRNRRTCQRHPPLAVDGRRRRNRRNANGWEFWYVNVDGEKTVLADLRTQYLHDHGE